MKMELYKEIALTQDFPEYHLKKGDLATLIDFLPHLTGEEEGCVLEIFNALGESIDVVTVPISAVKKLSSQDVWVLKCGF